MFSDRNIAFKTFKGLKFNILEMKNTWFFNLSCNILISNKSDVNFLNISFRSSCNKKSQLSIWKKLLLQISFNLRIFIIKRICLNSSKIAEKIIKWNWRRKNLKVLKLFCRRIVIFINKNLLRISTYPKNKSGLYLKSLRIIPTSKFSHTKWWDESVMSIAVGLLNFFT